MEDCEFLPLSLPRSSLNDGLLVDGKTAAESPTNRLIRKTIEFFRFWFVKFVKCFENIGLLFYQITGVSFVPVSIWKYIDYLCRNFNIPMLIATCLTYLQILVTKIIEQI